MDLLWTPWRRAFVEGATGADDAACFLCTTAAAHDDRPNLILLRGERAFVIMNRYPYNTGHLMIAPYAHTGDLAALDGVTAQELTALMQRCVGVLRQAYFPQGFNLGINLGKAAGAGVPDHLHMHVVPRWTGDTNFMPIVAETKVLPETLDETYTRLVPLFQGVRRYAPAIPMTFSLEPHALRIDKPWGYEVLLSPPDAPYSSKLIHVRAGKRLSLQVHDIKVETQTLVDGRGVLVLEGADGQLHEIQMQPGVGYHIAVGQRHRTCAAPDGDATIFETSTPEIGTTLRLEDDYARPDETEELRRAERASH